MNELEWTLLDNMHGFKVMKCIIVVKIADTSRQKWSNYVRANYTVMDEMNEDGCLYTAKKENEWMNKWMKIVKECCERKDAMDRCNQTMR